MTVARRLRIALGLNFALLLAVVAFHLRTIEHAVAAAQSLAGVSTRLMLAQSRQAETIALLDASAAKFDITHDRGYLARFGQLRAEFAAQLASARALPVSGAERAALASLQAAWARVETDADAFAARGRLAPPSGALAKLRTSLEALHGRADVVGVASREAMREHIADADADGDRALQAAWLAALIALAVAVATGVALHRAITRPLGELSRGAREVARGEFGHRIAVRENDGEFMQLANAFNVMISRLAKVDRLKQDFVATVSHDLKSPLASLRETTSLLLDQIPGPLRDAQRRVLLLQRESADRLGRMIAKLLDLSRLEAGIPLVATPLNVREFAARAVAHAAAAGRDRGVQVLLDGTVSGALRISGDEDWLRHLLDNLLENAIKFSPPDGVVDVAARGADGRLLLSVADRGPGVEPGQAARIFDRFYQTATGRSVAARGTGLGLAICREVARAHGGTIGVAARPGGGSVFVVNLPLLVPDARPAAERRLVPRVAAAARAAS